MSICVYVSVSRLSSSASTRAVQVCSAKLKKDHVQLEKYGCQVALTAGEWKPESNWYTSGL
jgi:hypothetical protein